MARVLCCVRNVDLVGRWQKAMPDHVFELVPNLKSLLNTESAIVILDGAFSDVVQFASTPGWKTITENHKVIFGDPTPEENRGLAALQTGCQGYCHLYVHPEQLRSVLEVVMAGQLWVGANLMKRLLGAIQLISPVPEVGDACSMLSEREKDVSGCVLNGLANKEIGAHLGISVRTVKAHLTSIFTKMGVRDRLQLVAKLRSNR